MASFLDIHYCATFSTAEIVFNNYIVAINLFYICAMREITVRYLILGFICPLGVHACTLGAIFFTEGSV